MDCNCPEGYILIGEDCVKTVVVENVVCPPNCETILTEDGNIQCNCVDSVDPIVEQEKTPIYFDNEDYFEDVSWTLSYSPTEGNWNSFFSFYPDYYASNNNYFQTGYNWAENSGTLWNHTMSNASFGVFNGRLHPFIVEYPIANQNAFKMLNSLSIDVEAKRYQDQWNTSVWGGVGFNKLNIYNNTNNSGVLNLIEQKTISDARKYPKTNGNESQDILFTSNEGKWNINYFFNRIINENNNIPMWLRDKNNIFKELNPKAISFKGKRVNERLKGDSFLVRLTNDSQSRFSVILKSGTSDETIIE
ncbi:MAG TPA: hypothetical protein VLA48_03365 [Nitrososphaeraceae archaeon]|nr:hypothetical protein [Nitrososphaeraceae archaeon]